MRFLVTGATGFIGMRLCDALAGSGNEVVALSRNPDRAGHIPAVDVFPWDPSVSPPPVDAFRGVDVVVHLAAESIRGRWTAAKKAEIQKSRTVGTRRLVEAMGELFRRPRVLISASATGYYGDRGEEPLSETSAPGRGFVADVCRSWEHEASLVERFNVRSVRLRMGLVLGGYGGALQALVPLFRAGFGGPIGKGRQWWSWVHIDDVIGLIQFLAEHEVSGAVNATAPHPVRQREFARTLGGVMRRPAFLPAPAAAIRLALGEFAGELLNSRKVLPQAATEAGFTFRYPDLRAALENLVPPY